ncbi:hypothetical protein CfE428DRAFT_0422 [Chthoniobacter flavus Ellin428]|uniref:Uncharacterized protein n=1 Tax=Chthoniobacter flavus Ellin428 TaxID=497964 RepID=B4CUQ9_9BACT|nr:hypothetical protein [Chthoniobacter flavus]EDY22297.1 hypothetical protein CfE428DRAFT_0422 [Chthoniobacter flavus Ellin428]TCO94686.1 hypothetical protein EV701_102154 [Chthoniobacter flavus]
MNRKIKRYTGYAAAVVVGMLAFCFVASSRADNSIRGKTTICYRCHTLVVDNGEVKDYLRSGATVGACATSP